MPIWVWLAAGALGGIFAIVRFLLDAVVSSRAAGEFPWGTFTINVTGSFALGVLVGVAPTGNALLLAGTASIGSYTTFSTWMLESHRLGEDDDRGPLALYVLGSLLVGLAAAACGRILGRTL
ncbi:MAG: fluoride efflux transporter CrcB [Gaiellaceae bacterium]